MGGSTMSSRKHQVLIVSAAIFAAWWSPVVSAMTQLETTLWVPGCTETWVWFVGRTSATDLTQGLRFSLHEANPGSNELLTDVALPWTAPYPPVGTEIRVF